MEKRSKRSECFLKKILDGKTAEEEEQGSDR
jgi:hypothetical protein